MKKDTYIYPAYFTFEEKGVSIEFPDLPGCLPCAESAEQAFRNAKEALGLHLFGMEEDGEAIPAPTPVQALHPVEGSTVALVEVYMPSIRMAAVNRSVNRTVTLPAWLNAAAQERGVNFSQVLQDALKQQLHLPGTPA